MGSSTEEVIVVAREKTKDKLGVPQTKLKRYKINKKRWDASIY